MMIRSTLPDLAIRAEMIVWVVVRLVLEMLWARACGQLGLLGPLWAAWVCHGSSLHHHASEHPNLIWVVLDQTRPCLASCALAAWAAWVCHGSSLHHHASGHPDLIWGVWCVCQCHEPATTLQLAVSAAIMAGLPVCVSATMCVCVFFGNPEPDPAICLDQTVVGSIRAGPRPCLASCALAAWAAVATWAAWAAWAARAVWATWVTFVFLSPRERLATLGRLGHSARRST